jgi:hypothetical protein
MKRILLIALGAVLATAVPQMVQAQSTNIIFDDFNINEGHFATVPTFSGSTVGILASSTADRVTVSPVEGVGCERLVFNTNGAASVRVRFLSGSGSAANNTAFVTSAAEDGWIGFYLKTTNSGWDVQPWLEGASNNGGVRQEVIPDGEWHLYEWDLDNVDGDIPGNTNGWGSIPGILGGVAEVADGSHTLDSIVFRSSILTTIEQQTNVIFLDFYAKTASGSLSNLLAGLDPCNNIAGVQAIGPISTNSNQVIVSGVSATATAISVYQDSGAGNVLIGSKVTDITAGNNTVTVSGLAKTAKVVATQTVGGQESCIPTSSFAITVGGGANPSLRAALTIRETTSTGPVGDPGISSSTSLHFLNATDVSGGAPIDAGIIYPSNGWQTVTFLRGTNEVVSDSANAAGVATAGAGYLAADSVSILVYAYRTLPNGITIYSAGATITSDITSNDVFSVNWTWDAVPGATGYRVMRNLNLAGYIEYQDVTSSTFNDVNTGWILDPTVTATPTTAQSGRSVQWNPTVSNTNNLPGQWGILESISFAISDLDETGPFNLYIDNLQNGDTVFQTFENAPAGTTDYAFRQPSFSGTTGGNILTTPNVGQVSNAAADTGTKSFQIGFQWNGTNATRWLRLTTSGVNNPQVNLDEPISFRLLMQPVNATPPAAPAAPLLSISQVADKLVLNWTGGHRLQTAVNVTGAYTNAPQTLSPSIWTNITLGGWLSPWTNNFVEPTRFFRLVD